MGWGAFLTTLAGSTPLPLQGSVSLSDKSCPHLLFSWERCESYSDYGVNDYIFSIFSVSEVARR